MAKIITVHGTFASGPVSGNDWWQKDSDFERNIRELVTSDTGPIDWEPHVWDGTNSERSRRISGMKLRQMLISECQSAPIVILAHSHGGTVVSNSLLYLSEDTRVSERIQGVISVGTPFPQAVSTLRMRLARYFQADRLSSIIFDIALPLMLLLTAVEVTSRIVSIIPEGIRRALETIGQTIWLGPISFILAIIALLVLGAISVRRTIKALSELDFSTSATTSTRNKFDGRFVALYHQSDEAISALGAVDKVKFGELLRWPMFGEVIVSLFFSFVIGGVILASLAFDSGFCHSTGSISSSAFCKFANYTKEDVYLVHEMNYLRHVGDKGYALLMGLLVAWGSFVFINGILPNRLSHALRRQIEVKTFGCDLPGSRITSTSPRPHWSDRQIPPLPIELGDEVERLSNRAASQSIAHFRSGLAVLAKAQSISVIDALFGSFNWNELIHTSYFDVPRVRKLIAVAICQCPGFQPSNAFRSDPDYEIVLQWYSDLVSTRTGLSDGVTDRQVTSNS